MAKAFKDAVAFRASLEQRLRNIADSRGADINYLRLKLVIERLLARLFAKPAAPWLLKGGYAMELRYRPRARTTRDIDLSVKAPAVARSETMRLDTIRDELQEAAEIDLGDFFRFRIAAARTELQGAPLGGGRFPCEVLLAGRVFARFHIDVGIGDPLLGSPEQLNGDDLLDFAGIDPPLIRAIPRAQQFAEKIHAYTFPWTDRPNTRTKDLVDLIMLLEEGGVAASAELRQAIHAVFATRHTHPVPSTLPDPPLSWSEEFRGLAAETGIFTTELSSGFARVKEFWDANDLGAGQYRR